MFSIHPIGALRTMVAFGELVKTPGRSSPDTRNTDPSPNYRRTGLGKRILQQDFHDIELEMSLIRIKICFMPSLLETLSVSNIALEFNESWLDDLPGTVSHAKRENSAQGYFAYLYSKSSRKGLSFDGLWIIDKEAFWFDKDSQDHDTVYRDFDAEYVEVQWSDAVHYETEDASVNASHFMMEIGAWMVDHQPYHIHPEPEEVFRLLVRRDNEAQDPRIGRDPREVSHCTWGWYFHDLKDLDDDLDDGLDEGTDTYMDCWEF
ncbi:uncharacterized protein B0J16DRAFT_406339 [Fusarium flagelliforme]|uniref:uncharacterized protein n=1 Tax=Fusarium flagelliforme TaxID=2675880 RepID=UPI001E8E277C|nr:uncharacterized protein B0J16DRAFT_406339 [Fusarium flagelliforme]KAH7173967.1 hypothetical protein B0J16DRAFT_406339 [Fusarium flagelliforme]